MSRVSPTALVLLVVVLALVAGQPQSALAAGPGYVSGVVYLDKDMDGIRDETDPPLAGYTVKLTESNNSEAMARTAISGRDGLYRFDGLKQGIDYELTLESDNRILCATGGSRGVRLENQVSQDGFDLGLVKKGNGRLSGNIFNDLNGNGSRDSGEPPLGGWGLALGNLEVDRTIYCNLEATADADGSFAFEDLPPFSYALFAWWASAPEPMRGPYWQPWEVNYDSAADPAAAPDDIEYPRIALTDRQDSRRVDVGVHFPTDTGAITGRVFDDRDLDGVRDDGERSDYSSEIWLWRQVGGRLLRWEHFGYASNYDGDFLFTGLPAGEYYLAASDRWREATTPTTPAGYPYRWVTVSEGQLSEGVDFGYVPPWSETPAAPSATPTADATPELQAPIVGTNGTRGDATLLLAVLLLVAGVGTLGSELALVRHSRR